MCLLENLCELIPTVKADKITAISPASKKKLPDLSIALPNELVSSPRVVISSPVLFIDSRYSFIKDRELSSPVNKIEYLILLPG